MKTRYDMIASLGGNCSAAIQLKNRGLRREAYPLDWVYMESEKSVAYLARGFENGFSDLALRENLRLFTDGLKTGVARYSYRDVHTGFCFIHQFDELVDDVAAYERQIAVVRRRTERFLNRVRESKRVLFILAVRFAFDPGLVVDLKSKLRRLFPGTEFDIHVKEFNAKLSSPLALAESWPAELGFSGGERFAHDAFPYSFDYAGREWAFLDEVELNGFLRPRPRGWARVVYKAWKKSGKWLNDRGYGVLGVKF